MNIAQFSAFHDALNAAIKNQTPANMIRRNEARTVLEKSIRGMVNQFLRFPPITDADRKEMGIPIRDTIRTPHTKVEEMVDMLIKLRNENELMVHFRQRGADNRAKPTGYDGAVIIWCISDTEPATLKEYGEHTLASKTPYAVKFDTHESGKRVWFRAAWQNARGILGDYCEAKSAVVP